MSAPAEHLTNRRDPGETEPPSRRIDQSEIPENWESLTGYRLQLACEKFKPPLEEVVEPVSP